jgi:hypothetical protein
MRNQNTSHRSRGRNNSKSEKWWKNIVRINKEW